MLYVNVVCASHTDSKSTKGTRTETSERENDLMMTRDRG